MERPCLSVVNATMAQSDPYPMEFTYGAPVAVVDLAETDIENTVLCHFLVHALSEKGGEIMDEREYNRRKDWYDLYVVSNYLNRLEEPKSSPTWCFSDLWFWFIVAREDWPLSQAADYLKIAIEEELGVPIDRRTLLYDHYQTLLRLCD